MTAASNSLQPSAVEPFSVRGRSFFVKRDDTIDPFLSGNKYRKLYTLLQTPPTQYRKVVSYGGTQSNAMLSIAALAQRKGWGFDYYSKPVPQHLKAAPTGNLKMALSLDMHLIEVAHDMYGATVQALRTADQPGTCFIPQGGADSAACEGVVQAAREIRSWQLKEGIGDLTVVTPSGTGTTAYYLATALSDVKVMTCAVVGDADYLREQMALLGEVPDNLHIMESTKKHHFAKPYPELHACYRELVDAGLDIDLIYGAKTWYELFNCSTLEGTVLYLHSGGLIGNETMLERYRYKGII